MTAEPSNGRSGTRVPGFTGRASLYRTSGQYRTSGADFGLSTTDAQAVTPAYYPGSESMAKCQGCLHGCLTALGICTAGAVFFPPALAACATGAMACQGG